jgi:hypothetical protein
MPVKRKRTVDLRRKRVRNEDIIGCYLKDPVHVGKLQAIKIDPVCKALKKPFQSIYP